VVLSDGFEQTILRDEIEETLLKWEKREKKNRKDGSREFVTQQVS